MPTSNDNSTRLAYRKNCQRVIFFMSNKESRSINEQIALLKGRGMKIDDELEAYHLLSHVSYYRLKGYWWDMQSDKEIHLFRNNADFKEVITRYKYDKELRILLFGAIETIEVALRTKLIYHLSQSYSGQFYTQPSLFEDKAIFHEQIATLKSEFLRSNKPFVKEFKTKYGVWNGRICTDLKENPDSWILFELASFGTLSKIYKNLYHQLPEKARIANDFGLNLHSELSSWLEAITYLRNLVAHHSRLFGRTMVKKPMLPSNPRGLWHTTPIDELTRKKPYAIIVSLLYMCNALGEGGQFKHKVIAFIKSYPCILASKLGFPYDWEKEPIWEY